MPACLRFRRQEDGGSWELALTGRPLEGLRAADLRLDVGPREVRLEADGLREVRIPIPEHAEVDEDRCSTRLKRGVLTIAWPPRPAAHEREFVLREVSESPLIFAGGGFLDARTCAEVVAAAKAHGKKTTGLGDYEVKYDMSPRPLLEAEMSPALGQTLEAIYARIDALCGVVRHPDEQNPRVHCYSPSSSQNRARMGRMPLGLHVDTNGRPHRIVTAIVYLTEAEDGATVFPCAGDARVREVGEELAREGTLHSGNLADPDHRPLAAELLAAANEGRGYAARPEVGKLVIFFSRRADGEVDGTSWHGGARVLGGAKWILQFFKEVPADWRGPGGCGPFAEACREPPDFALHGVLHRVER